MTKLIFAAFLSIAPTGAFGDVLSEAVNTIAPRMQMCIVEGDWSWGKTELSIACDGHETLKQRSEEQANRKELLTQVISQIMQKGLRLNNCETTSVGKAATICYLSR